MLRDGYNIEYNMSTAGILVLSMANALLGAAFSAAGIYMFTLVAAEFSYTVVPVSVLALGLVTLYVAGAVAAGAVNCSRSYMRTMVAFVALVVLGELILLISVAHDPLSIRRFHGDAWKRIYNVNPLALQIFEHMYGCCGFKDRFDMPSHAGCSNEVQSMRAVSGCAEYLNHAAFRVSKMALRWCTAVLVVQVLMLASAMDTTGFREYLDRLGHSGLLRAAAMLLNTVAATAAIFLVVTGIVDRVSTYSVFGGATMPVGSIVIGAVVACVSLLGIVGSAKRSQYLCGTYAGLAAVLVVLQMIALTVLWLRPYDTEDSFARAWETLYNDDPNTIRFIERDLKCCGFRSPVDMPVPATCSIKKKYGFSTGCLGPLESAWERKRESVIWAGVVMVGAQLVTLLMGAELARRYKRSREGYERLAGHAEDSALVGA
ncbi:hypothetical protein LPJ61_001268 [Coemansia biformis]|uniref:Tetraspanin n=1 Tax=Coemansia biformis TaxID=1286918 RepID=A0A9W7YAB3_9FUNG|nr:hypothetical protein LPJ61_001268 [Coemansia biformis]